MKDMYDVISFRSKYMHHFHIISQAVSYAILRDYI